MLSGLKETAATLRDAGMGFRLRRGVVWCFGLHDRHWPARPVYSTVRSMVATGLKRKFDADAYARVWEPGNQVP
jgi:hypothetical protein